MFPGLTRVIDSLWGLSNMDADIDESASRLFASCAITRSQRLGFREPIWAVALSPRIMGAGGFFSLAARQISLGPRREMCRFLEPQSFRFRGVFSGQTPLSLVFVGDLLGKWMSFPDKWGRTPI